MENLIIICPAYNEGNKLPGLIDEFKSTKYTRNLLVVNSGSDDDSENILIDKKIKHLTLPVNRGGGYAIIQGIKYAIENNIEICCVIGGNGKMDPKEIEKFINKIQEDGFEFVQGSRYLENQNNYLPPFRRVMIPIVTNLYRKIFKVHFTDATCGFRAFKTDLIRRAGFNIDSKLLYTYAFEPYFFSQVMLDTNIKKTEVPVKMRYQKGDKRYTKIRPLLDYPALFLPYLIAYLFPKKFN